MVEHLSENEKSDLIEEDVEVILMRLERARNAIHEIRPVLLNHVKKKQPRFLETERIYTDFMNNLRHEGEPSAIQEPNGEPDRSIDQKQPNCLARYQP